MARIHEPDASTPPPGDAARPRALEARSAGVAAGLAAGAAVSLLVSPVTLLAFLLAACVVAAGELFRFARRGMAAIVPLAGFAGIGGAFAFAYHGPETLLAGIPAVAAGTAALALVVLVARGRVDGALAGVSATVAATMYVGVLGAFVLAMRQTAGGFRVVLAFGLMAVANEAAAFAGGRAFGRHPVAPSIGGGHTWEGVASGTAASVVAAIIVAASMSETFATSRAMLLAGVVAVLVPLGGLAETTLKGPVSGEPDAAARTGIFGLVDGILFAAPVFYFTYRAMVR